MLFFGMKRKNCGSLFFLLSYLHKKRRKKKRQRHFNRNSNEIGYIAISKEKLPPTTSITTCTPKHYLLKKKRNVKKNQLELCCCCPLCAKIQNLGSSLNIFCFCYYLFSKRRLAVNMLTLTC